MQTLTSAKEGHVPMKTKHFLVTTLFLAIQLSPRFVAAAPQLTPKKEQSVAISASGLTNEDVTTLLKSGLTSEIVMAKINSSPCDFNTSTTALQDLKTAGVPDPVILAMVQAPKGLPRSASAQPSAPVGPKQQSQPEQRDQQLPKGCMAVRPIGSHAFRNVMLFGAVGAFISHEQYQVVDVMDYPSHVGQKYHGNDLQTIQSSGTRVGLLPKHYTAEDLHKACH
jgi:hypothetical protein